MKRIFVILTVITLLSGCQTLNERDTPNLWSLKKNIEFVANQRCRVKENKDRVHSTIAYGNIDIAGDGSGWFKTAASGGAVGYSEVRGNLYYHPEKGIRCGDDHFKRSGNAVSHWREASESDVDGNSEKNVTSISDVAEGKQIYEYENSLAVVKVNGARGFVKVKSDHKIYNKLFKLVKNGENLEVGYFVTNEKYKPKPFHFKYEVIKKLKAKKEDGVRTFVVKDDEFVKRLISDLSKGRYLYLSARQEGEDKFVWWRLLPKK